MSFYDYSKELLCKLASEPKPGRYKHKAGEGTDKAYRQSLKNRGARSLATFKKWVGRLKHVKQGSMPPKELLTNKKMWQMVLDSLVDPRNKPELLRSAAAAAHSGTLRGVSGRGKKYYKKQASMPYKGLREISKIRKLTKGERLKAEGPFYGLSKGQKTELKRRRRRGGFMTAPNTAFRQRNPYGRKAYGGKRDRAQEARTRAYEEWAKKDRIKSKLNMYRWTNPISYRKLVEKLKSLQ